MIFTAKNAAKYVTQGIEWEVAFFDFVDCFRKSENKENLITEIPDTTNDIRLDSLLKSMVMYLCDEANISSPEWAEKDGWLKEPWFVCGLSRMYSFCLVESHIRFKQNNIFVLSNFMDRV